MDFIRLIIYRFTSFCPTVRGISNSGQITKLITKIGQEPRYSTEKFWAKFSYNIIGEVKAKPDKWIEEEQNPDISKEKALKVEKCKAGFLEALGDLTLAEIQLQNLKTKIYDH